MIDPFPDELFAPGPMKVMWWQWIALPLFAAFAWFAGALLARIARVLLVRAAAGTTAVWDDALVARLNGPFVLGWSLVLMFFGLHWLGLPPAALDFATDVLRALAFVAFFWALARGVDVAAEVLRRSSWGRVRAGSRSLVALTARAAKLAVFAIAVIAVLSEFGYPVASLIAGLGLGGLALALAAQKTVENLFGAFSIAADQPFREGDLVKIEDFVGMVEAIGLRSTKIRTADRTVISVPNGKLAEMRVETFAARDRIRFTCVLGLVYGTNASQLRQVLDGLERALRAHPKLWQEDVGVHFRALTPTSLEIEVSAWFDTPHYGEFQRYREEVLLEFMDVVEQAGSAFVSPPRPVAAPPEPQETRASGIERR